MITSTTNPGREQCPSSLQIRCRARPVTAVISSLVAAYFGVRSGSLALQKANEAENIRRQPITRQPESSK
jgi:hypothetical protein